MIRSIATARGRCRWSWGKIVKAAESFYVDSRACVRVGIDVREWFPVNVGLRQGCVMPPCCLMYIWMVWCEM